MQTETETRPGPVVKISSSGLTAEIALLGAELVRLRDEAGRDLLWDGDPAFWTGHAPLLFPIVGRLRNDELVADGVSHPMKQHGFARRSLFELVEQADSRCRLRLRSSDETRAVYPFDFNLEAVYAIEGATLAMSVTVSNTGHRNLPFAMGFHPAFRWPLPYGAPRSTHEVSFERDEPASIRQVVDGLMSSSLLPTPVEGRHLALNDDLFSRDALIFLDVASHALRYGPPNGRALRVAYPGMPDLGLWSKRDAGFLCVEPWAGYASPQAFDEDFSLKPGLTILEPGQAKDFGMTVTVEAP